MDFRRKPMEVVMVDSSDGKTHYVLYNFKPHNGHFPLNMVSDGLGKVSLDQNSKNIFFKLIKY